MPNGPEEPSGDYTSAFACSFAGASDGTDKEAKCSVPGACPLGGAAWAEGDRKAPGQESSF